MPCGTWANVETSYYGVSVLAHRFFRQKNIRTYFSHAKAQRSRSVMCSCSSVQSKLHTELTEIHRNFASHVLRMSAPSAWDNYPRRMGSVCSVDSVWKSLSRRRRRPTQTLRNFAPLREKQKKFCVFPWVLCETFNGTPQTHAEFYSSRKGAKYREACVRLFFRHKNKRT